MGTGKGYVKIVFRCGLPWRSFTLASLSHHEWLFRRTFHIYMGILPKWSGSRLEDNRRRQYGSWTFHLLLRYEFARDLNVLELDSNRNIALMQDVNLTSGAYELSFLSAKRGAHLDGRPSDTCDFEVLWNNQLVAFGFRQQIPKCFAEAIR